MATRKSKYDPLRDFMRTLTGSLWRTSFDEIEKTLGSKLPASAYKYQAFWSREADPKTHVWKQAWMSAGWETDSVDLERHLVTFRRMQA